MNYKVVVTKNSTSEVVLESDFNCGYLFLGQFDGCALSRVSEGCDFDTLLHTAYALVKFAYEKDDALESFARLLYESKNTEENDGS